MALDDIFAIAAIVAGMYFCYTVELRLTVSALPMGILEFFMAADGFGKDIWTIPAAKIYRIVQVRKL